VQVVAEAADRFLAWNALDRRLISQARRGSVTGAWMSRSSADGATSRA